MIEGASRKGIDMQSTLVFDTARAARPGTSDCLARRAAVSARATAGDR